MTLPFNWCITLLFSLYSFIRFMRKVGETIQNKEDSTQGWDPNYFLPIPDTNLVENYDTAYKIDNKVKNIETEVDNTQNQNYEPDCKIDIDDFELKNDNYQEERVAKFKWDAENSNIQDQNYDNPESDSNSGNNDFEKSDENQEEYKYENSVFIKEEPQEFTQDSTNPRFQ